MNSTEILKGNKLIADFMASGDTLICPMYGGLGCQWSKYTKEELSPKLKYHESFDWLMEVVFKINNICFYKHSVLWTGLTIRTNQVFIVVKDFQKTVFISSNNRQSKSLIMGTFECVVEFIKYYNKQKQQ